MRPETRYSQDFCREENLNIKHKTNLHDYN